MTRRLERLFPMGILAVGVFVLACSPSESRRQDKPTSDTGTLKVGAPGPLDSTVVTVYKTPTCGCCTAWVEHLRKEGFRVVAVDTADLDGIKRDHDVPQRLESCHTATVGGYVIEGHVPAADIRRLLAEGSQVRGLAVPGMPQGSPGMETGVKESYEVLAFTRDGRTTVFAKH